MDSQSRPPLSDAFILKTLLEGASTIQFTSEGGLEENLRDLSDEVSKDESQTQYLIFTDVPPDTFDHLGTRKSSLLFHSACLYLKHYSILQVKMTAPPHAFAANRINTILTNKAIVMGTPLCEHTGLRKHLGNVIKEPDGSWGPEATTYPTCALEVGYSESLSRLCVDARIWLEMEESPVVQAITINIHRREAMIIFQKWELVSPDLQADQRRLDSLRRRVINNQSLHISFLKLFGRNPTPGTLETDIHFTANDLCNIARRVWVAQPKRPGSDEMMLPLT